jgi:PAS domain S-box-containing protein
MGRTCWKAEFGGVEYKCRASGFARSLAARTPPADNCGLCCGSLIAQHLVPLVAVSSHLDMFIDVNHFLARTGVWRSKSFTISRYAVAVLSIATALLASHLVVVFLHTEPFASLFLCAIMFAAWFGGFGPGLLATILALLTFYYFLVPPIDSFSLKSNSFAPDFKDLPRMVILAITALFVNFLSASQRDAEKSLQGSRVELLVAIEDQRRIEAALLHSEMYLAEAQRLSHTGSFGWNIATGEIIWSEETFRIFQCDRTTKPTLELTIQRVHSEDRDRVQQTMELASSDGKDFDHECRLLMPDGSVKHIRTVALAVKDASGNIEFAGAVMDVTASKQAQERLQALLNEKQKLASLMENSSDFIGYAPIVEQIDYLNAAGRRLVGLELDEDISTYHMNDFHPPEERQLFMDRIFPMLSRDGHWEGERALRHLRTYAVISVIQTVCFITDEDSNRRTGIATICRDVTERKREIVRQRQAEEALLKAQADLEHVTRLTTMGELAASIAHEIGQPLMAIVTNAETCFLRLAKDQPELDEARKAAERVIRDGHRAGDVVKSIRALVRKSAAETAQLDINIVIRDVLDLMRTELRRQDVSLKAEFCVGLEPVTGDRVQLQQVVLNLVMNGVEAMSGVTNRSRVLHVNTQRDTDGNIVIAVQDSGAGLDPSMMDRIFERFFTTKPEGMGMGLSICRSIVEAHGGRLWASPQLPHGSIFRFTLPRAKSGRPIESSS